MGYVNYDQAMADAKQSVAERKRQEAVELAEARQDYYVSAPGIGPRPDGPMSERQMRATVEAILDSGRKPLVLKVVEDYGK